MAYKPIAASVHSAAKRLWFNEALELTSGGLGLSVARAHRARIIIESPLAAQRSVGRK